jgi:hypothetical protein
MPAAQKGHIVYNIVTVKTSGKTPESEEIAAFPRFCRIVRTAAPLYNGNSSAPVSTFPAAGGKRSGARRAQAPKTA